MRVFSLYLARKKVEKNIVQFKSLFYLCFNETNKEKTLIATLLTTNQFIANFAKLDENVTEFVNDFNKFNASQIESVYGVYAKKCLDLSNNNLIKAGILYFFVKKWEGQFNNKLNELFDFYFELAKIGYIDEKTDELINSSYDIAITEFILYRNKTTI